MRTAPTWDTHRLIDSATLTAPSVRLVVVEAWRDEAGPGHAVHPVVALTSTITTEYTKYRSPGGRDPVRSADPATLEADGWSYQCSGPTLDAVVIDPESGELTEARHCFDGSNVVHRIVAAPWPAEEDDERLAPIIATAEMAASAKAERDQRPGSAAVRGRTQIPAERSEKPSGKASML